MTVKLTLLGELTAANGDGRDGTLLPSLAKVDLLVMDDWSLSCLDEAERRDLLEIVEETAINAAPPSSPPRSPWRTGMR